MVEFEHFEIELTFTQPLLKVDCQATEQMPQSDVICFGTWMKGDKGDPGETPELEYATNEDIDALFD